MASVHLPSFLVERIDRLASVQGVSRDRLIAEACEELLATHRAEWPADFFEAAHAADLLDLHGLGDVAPRRRPALRL